MCFQLSEALQASTQAAAELSLQQKLREDDQIRMEELEETILEKDQEVQKLQVLVTKLQGEVGFHPEPRLRTKRGRPQDLCGVCRSQGS